MTTNTLIEKIICGRKCYQFGTEFAGSKICKPAGKEPSDTFLVSEIVYAEANDKLVDVRLESGKVRLMTIPLYRLEEVFGSEFIRVSRRTLVRKKKIVRWDKDDGHGAYIRLEGVVEGIRVSRNFVRKVKAVIGPFGSKLNLK